MPSSFRKCWLETWFNHGIIFIKTSTEPDQMALKLGSWFPVSYSTQEHNKEPETGTHVYAFESHLLHLPMVKSHSQTNAKLQSEFIGDAPEEGTQTRQWSKASLGAEGSESFRFVFIVDPHSVPWGITNFSILRMKGQSITMAISRQCTEGGGDFIKNSIFT